MSAPGDVGPAKQPPASGTRFDRIVSDVGGKLQARGARLLFVPEVWELERDLAHALDQLAVARERRDAMEDRMAALAPEVGDLTVRAETEAAAAVEQATAIEAMRQGCDAHDDTTLALRRAIVAAQQSSGDLEGVLADDAARLARSRDVLAGLESRRETLQGTADALDAEVAALEILRDVLAEVLSGLPDHADAAQAVTARFAALRTDIAARAGRVAALEAEIEAAVQDERRQQAANDALARQAADLGHGAAGLADEATLAAELAQLENDLLAAAAKRDAALAQARERSVQRDAAATALDEAVARLGALRQERRELAARCGVVLGDDPAKATDAWNARARELRQRFAGAAAARDACGHLALELTARLERTRHGHAAMRELLESLETLAAAAVQDSDADNNEPLPPPAGPTP